LLGGLISRKGRVIGSFGFADTLVVIKFKSSQEIIIGFVDLLRQFVDQGVVEGLHTTLYHLRELVRGSISVRVMNLGELTVGMCLIEL